MKEINSKDNPLIKKATKIVKGKLSGSFPMIAIEGSKLIMEAYSSGLKPDMIFIDSDADNDELELLQNLSYRIPAKLMRQLSSLNSACSSIGFFSPPAQPELETFMRSCQTLVCLDRIQDPGNLGTIIRTSEAMGADAVIVLKGGCCPLNTKVIRASMGSSFRLPVFADVCADTLLSLIEKNSFSVICADMNGENLVNFPFPKRSALFFGQEGQGLAPSFLKVCSTRLAIPMSGKVESLNVALATAICLYELQRGRVKDKLHN